MQNIDKKIESINNLIQNSFNEAYSLTKLKDSKIGYSIKRNYDEKTVRIFGVKNDKKYVSLTHLSVNNTDLTCKKKIPVNLEIRCLLADDGRFAYNYEFIINKRRKPINLNSHGYALDLSSEQFYKDNQKEDLIDIYNEVYQKHIKPSLVIKGLPVRAKLALNRFIVFLLKLTSIVTGLILQWAYYYSPYRKNFKTILATGEDKSSVKKPSIENERFDFHGYKVSPRTITTYGFIHLALYTIFYLFDYYPIFIKNIFKYQFLTFIYLVTTLTLFSNLIPKILGFALFKLDKIILNYEFKSIKI